MKDRRRIVGLGEVLVLSASAGLSAVVAVLELLGLLDGAPWLRDRIPTITLLLLSLLVAFVVAPAWVKLGRLGDSIIGIQARLQADAVGTLSRLREQVDPSIDQLLGDYVRELIATLDTIFQDRVVIFSVTPELSRLHSPVRVSSRRCE